MASVNDRLADEAVAHKIDLQRYSNTEVVKLVKLLNRSDTQLANAIHDAITRGVSPERLAQLEANLAAMRTINAEAYRQIGQEFDREIGTFAEYETTRELAIITAALPKSVLAKVRLFGTTPTQVRAAALSRPFQGRLLKEWMDGLEAGRAQRIRDAIRIGIVNQEPTEAIVRRIRGTRAASYADGLLERPRQDLATVVRSAIAHTAEYAREDTWQANADIVKASQWVSTLDNRTTQTCRLHDGHTYSLDDHRALDGGPPWGAGPGRIHWNCRSTSAPVLKSWRELGLSGLPESTRASMDGQVPASMTYAEWLAKQPMDRVEDILGPTRAKLYKQGGMKLEQFSDDRGTMYTLDELRRRDTAAFKRAGLA